MFATGIYQVLFQSPVVLPDMSFANITMRKQQSPTQKGEWHFHDMVILNSFPKVVLVSETAGRDAAQKLRQLSERDRPQAKVPENDLTEQSPSPKIDAPSLEN